MSIRRTDSWVSVLPELAMRMRVSSEFIVRPNYARFSNRQNLIETTLHSHSISVYLFLLVTLVLFSIYTGICGRHREFDTHRTRYIVDAQRSKTKPRECLLPIFGANRTPHSYGCRNREHIYWTDTNHTAGAHTQCASTPQVAYCASTKRTHTHPSYIPQQYTWHRQDTRDATNTLRTDFQFGLNFNNCVPRAICGCTSNMLEYTSAITHPHTSWIISMALCIHDSMSWSCVDISKHPFRKSVFNILTR